MSKDTQRNKWLLTQNSPQEHGYDHIKIKKILIENFSTIDFIAMVDEQGTNYHTHIFVYFKSRVRFSKIKKYFPKARIDQVNGTTSEVISYLKKDGKWLNDQDKQNTKIDGTYEEWGNLPPEKSNNSDLTVLYELVKAGYTNAEIIAENQDYILLLEKIDKLRTTLLTEKYKGTRRLDIKVIYLSGVTGSGKTRGVLDKHGDANVYRISDYQHPFDGYNCQEAICFDEYRSSLRMTDLLQYLDIYPIELPARYANKYACYNFVYIISNWTLEMQYSEVQEKDKESWKAFLRRIHEVHIYEKDGIIKKYNSVDEYMKRNEEFISIDDYNQVGIPFDD